MLPEGEPHSERTNRLTASPGLFTSGTFQTRVGVQMYSLVSKQPRCFPSSPPVGYVVIASRFSRMARGPSWHVDILARVVVVRLHKVHCVEGWSSSFAARG